MLASCFAALFSLNQSVQCEACNIYANLIRSAMRIFALRERGLR